MSPVVDPLASHLEEDGRRLRTGFLRLKGALCDPITGLSSYHLILDQLEMRCAGRGLGVIVLEFPALEALEQTHGWETSDRFLAGVASHLMARRGHVYPASTLICLEGIYGNAFTVFVMEGAFGREVTAVDLADACARLTLQLQGRFATAAWVPAGSRIEFSTGHALVSSNPATRFERLVHRGIREALAMTLRWTDLQGQRRATELRLILKEERLTTHYQPIVDMERGVIIGYEALTRGPENSPFERPEALFSFCGDRRLAGELDSLCRQKALRNARGFDPGKKLFLNSLPETLGTPDLIASDLGAVLEEVALQPNNLVLEITERTAIGDFEAFGRELEKLRRLGFLVAIDDVGTGYSSLQTISEVAADFLKIDISLIKNIHQSLIKQDLVHSLLRVASRTAARVIAEGIETAEEQQALRACGVRFGQGFYFARPAPAFPAVGRGGSGTA